MRRQTQKSKVRKDVQSAKKDKTEKRQVYGGERSRRCMSMKKIDNENIKRMHVNWTEAI